MDIQFSDQAVPDLTGGVSVRATVDGQTIACIFTQEALQDVSPHTKMLPPLDQYRANKSRLNGVAERLIRSGKLQSGQVRITTNDVRP